MEIMVQIKMQIDNEQNAGYRPHTLYIVNTGTTLKHVANVPVPPPERTTTRKKKMVKTEFILHHGTCLSLVTCSILR